MADQSSLDEIRTLLAQLPRSEIRKLRTELEFTEPKVTFLTITMDGIVYSERATTRTLENVIRYVEREAGKCGLLAPGERANPASIRTMMRHTAEYKAALERSGNDLSGQGQKEEDSRHPVAERSSTQTIHEAVSVENWRKTKGPAKIMLKHFDKGPDEIYTLCVKNGINSKRSVIKGLCYRYTLYKRARDILSTRGTMPANVEIVVLQNLEKSPRQIKSICRQLGIKAALNTVRTLHSYFRLFVELGG